jgi:hypothetical protein
MPVYLKKAAKAASTDQDSVRATVAEILESIRKRGEAAVREYAAKFDNWTRDFIDECGNLKGGGRLFCSRLLTSAGRQYQPRRRLCPEPS